MPVQMPQGVVPGGQYTARLEDGSKVVFTAPPNAQPGMQIEVEVPDESPADDADGGDLSLGLSGGHGMDGHGIGM